jgi:hypothetical protein
VLTACFVQLCLFYTRSGRGVIDQQGIKHALVSRLSPVIKYHACYNEDELQIDRRCPASLPQTSLGKQDVCLGIQFEIDPFLLYRPDQPLHLLRVLEFERGLSEPVMGRREHFHVLLGRDVDGLRGR